MFHYFITFTLLLTVTFQSNSNTATFFKEHCEEELVFNPSCTQRRWNHPTCVPWDTTQCKLNRNKAKNYCINYDCSVSFLRVCS